MSNVRWNFPVATFRQQVPSVSSTNGRRLWDYWQPCGKTADQCAICNFLLLPLSDLEADYHHHILLPLASGYGSQRFREGIWYHISRHALARGFPRKHVFATRASVEILMFIKNTRSNMTLNNILKVTVERDFRLQIFPLIDPILIPQLYPKLC